MTIILIRFELTTRTLVFRTVSLVIGRSQNMPLLGVLRLKEVSNNIRSKMSVVSYEWSSVMMPVVPSEF